MARKPRSRRVHHPLPAAAGCILVLALTGLIPALVSGQNPTEQLQAFAENARGFEYMRNPHMGVLRGGSEMTFSLVERVDVDYMVVGYCGEGCENLDLALVDSAGQEITADHLPDAQPMIAFRGESDRALWINVAMVSCATEACEFEVGVFWNWEGEGNSRGYAGASRMRQFKTELGELGFEPVGEEIRGVLGHTQEVTIPVSLEAENEYRIGAICDDDCLDVDLVLLGPEGDTVQSDFLRDAFPVLVHVPEADEEYSLTVRMALCFLEPCGFRVAAMSRRKGVGPGGILVEGAIVSEAMRRGELGLGDDRLPERGLFDAYRVRAAAGQRIIVDLTSHEFDTFLVIESPSGDQETNDDYDMDTGHSHVQWIAPEDGTYKIVVTTFDPTGGGAYLLQLAVAEEEGVEEGRIEPQDTAAAASPSMVVTHQGRLGPEDELTPEGAYVDTYTVEATPGQTLNADLVSSDFDTYLIIEAPGGNRVANDDDPLDPGHSRLEVQVSEQGTYTVLVTSFSAGEAGDYILQVGVYDEP